MIKKKLNFRFLRLNFIFPVKVGIDFVAVRKRIFSFLIIPCDFQFFEKVSLSFRDNHANQNKD